MIVIVLEGPDLAGKSTLATSLAAEIGRLHPLAPATRLRANGPPENDQDLYMDYYRQVEEAIAHRAGGVPTIFDRLHVGELIYGPLYRGHSRIDPDQLAKLEVLLDNNQILKVHVNSDHATLKTRLESRKDELIKNPDTLEFVSDRYREIVRDLDSWFEVDTTAPETISSLIAQLQWKAGPH
jgi:thymidylate kinase